MADRRSGQQRRRGPGAIGLAAGLLGVALGGFFDGILLHQILQWHHLLSGLDGEPFGDLRVQVLADGIFHLAMYGLAAVGLILLWRARDAADAPGAGRRLGIGLLLGFAAWHGLDAVAAHWLIGLHRIRMDSPQPLLWDIGWLIAFGLMPALAAVMLRRRPPPSLPPGGGGRARALALLAAAAVIAAGGWASRPAPGATATVVLFVPGTGGDRAIRALAEAGARPLWSDRSGDVWLIAPPKGGGRGREPAGSLLIGGRAVTAGCLAALRAT